MTIIEASNFFEKLLKEANNKRELRVYKGFNTILSNLTSRNLTEDELLSIETKLNKLNLNSNPTNKRKYYSKKLNIFKAYLKEEFSLISEGYYTALGMSLGMCFGVAIGAGFGGASVSVGVSLGMLIGLVIGRTKDVEAEKQNRVLKTKIYSL